MVEKEEIALTSQLPIPILQLLANLVLSLQCTGTLLVELVPPPPPDLKQQLLVIKTDHAVNCKCSDHSTYPTSHGPYRLVVDLGPADAPPEPPSRSPPFRPTAEGGPPLQLRPCFRRPHLQFGRSTFFWYFAVFIAPCEKYTYRTVNKQQYIHTPAEYKTTHLNFINEPLSSALYPRRLLGLGDLLMASPVVPTLAPHVNMLVTIVRTPLDFLHFVIGSRLGLLALRTTPSHGNEYHRTLTLARGALRHGSLRRG